MIDKKMAQEVAEDLTALMTVVGGGRDLPPESNVRLMAAALPVILARHMDAIQPARQTGGGGLVLASPEPAFVNDGGFSDAPPNIPGDQS